MGLSGPAVRDRIRRIIPHVLVREVGRLPSNTGRGRSSSIEVLR